MKFPSRKIIGVCALCALLLCGCALRLPWQKETSSASSAAENPFGAPQGFDVSALPAYSGEPAVVVRDNVPFFTEEEIEAALALAEADEESATDRPLLFFAELDAAGRAGTACAVLAYADTAKAERESLNDVRPTGWHNKKYDWIDGHYLYNRCHLVGYQLSTENSDLRNLITGTRYLNIDGMLPYEDEAAYYLRRHRKDVYLLYRVTPVFSGKDLVASGVLMEAMSLTDRGEELSYCVYCYNVQPGVAIDYATGENEASE